MPLAPYITKSKLKWIGDVITEFSPWPSRDWCLISMFLGAPCTIYELNRIQVKDIISRSGKLNKKFLLDKKDIRGDERFCYLTNNAVRAAIRMYLASTATIKVMIGSTKEYCGYDPDANFFLAVDHKPFSMTKKSERYTPDSLRRHIFNLLKEGGIENPTAETGRRTFAINLQKAGVHVSYINHLLGDKRLATTKKLLTSDPVDMAMIAAKAF